MKSSSFGFTRAKALASLKLPKNWQYNEKALRSQYRKIAVFTHPDKCRDKPESQAKEEFQHLHAAFEFLLQSAKVSSDRTRFDSEPSSKPNPASSTSVYADRYHWAPDVQIFSDFYSKHPQWKTIPIMSRYEDWYRDWVRYLEEQFDSRGAQTEEPWSPRGFWQNAAESDFDSPESENGEDARDRRVYERYRYRRARSMSRARPNSPPAVSKHRSSSVAMTKKRRLTKEAPSPTRRRSRSVRRPVNKREPIPEGCNTKFDTTARTSVELSATSMLAPPQQLGSNDVKATSSKTPPSNAFTTSIPRMTFLRLRDFYRTLYQKDQPTEVELREFWVTVLKKELSEFFALRTKAESKLIVKTESCTKNSVTPNCQNPHLNDTAYTPVHSKRDSIGGTSTGTGSSSATYNISEKRRARDEGRMLSLPKSKRKKTQEVKTENINSMGTPSGSIRGMGMPNDANSVMSKAFAPITRTANISSRKNVLSEVSKSKIMVNDTSVVKPKLSILKGIPRSFRNKREHNSRLNFEPTKREIIQSQGTAKGAASFGVKEPLNYPGTDSRMSGSNLSDRLRLWKSTRKEISVTTHDHVPLGSGTSAGSYVSVGARLESIPTDASHQTMPAPPSNLQPAFDLLLDKTLEDYNFDKKIKETMETAQRALFEGAKNFWVDKLGVFPESATMPQTEENLADDSEKKAESSDDNDFRRLMFFPVPSDMRLYVRALQKGQDKGEEITKPQMKLMSILYSLHIKVPLLLEAFVAYGGLSVLVRYMGYKESPHIMSQAMEISHKAFTIPAFQDVAQNVQQMSIAAVGKDDEQTWARMRTMLQEFKYWSVIKDALFNPKSRFFDVLEQIVLEHEDLYPNSRLNATKMIGFVLQIFVQPFYKVSEKTQSLRNSLQSDGASAAEYPHENVRVPKRLYAQLLSIYENCALPPDEVEVFVNLLGFLDDYQFDRERFEKEKEDFEEQSAMYKAGRGAKPTEKSGSISQDRVVENVAAKYAAKMKVNEWIAEENAEELGANEYVLKQLNVENVVDLQSAGSKSSTDSAMPSKLLANLACLPDEGAVVARDFVYQLNLYKTFGNEAFKAEEYPTAEACYARAVKDSPIKELIDYYVAGTSASDSARTREAQKSDTAHIIFQICHSRKGESKPDGDMVDSRPAEELCTCFERGLSSYPSVAKDIAIVHANLANSQLKLGRMPEAVGNATIATQSDPTYTKGWFRLAEALHFQNSKDDALAAIQKAEQLAPKDKSIQDLKVKIEG